MNSKVGIIRGDGIGPEVIDQSLRVVEAAGVELDTVDFDLGGDRYLRDGTLLPDETLEELRGFGALLLGAVGVPEVEPGTVERGVLLKLRQEFDMYINLRPIKNLEKGFDMVFVRENTEGLYAGKGEFIDKGTPEEVAVQHSVNTRQTVERCVRYGFELAGSRQRRELALVHKTNVLNYSGDLWERTFLDVSRDYPDVRTSYDQNVDAAGMRMVKQPGHYDVIVTDNMFGDILSDFGDALAGSIGSSASANLNPERTGPSMFEPVHGSAPDIAATGTANPMAAIRSVAMMLDFLGRTEPAEVIETACAAIEAGGGHNGDLVKTTDSVIKNL